MTEKRFTIEYVQGNPTIFHIVENGEHIDEMKIVDLLNKFASKNEELKQDKVMLQTNVEKLSNDVEYLMNLSNEHLELWKQTEIKRMNLEEDNEQLKEIIVSQRDAIKRDNKRENKAIGEINELRKENEQLREEIKDFQDLLGNKEEELLKPILRMIDDRITQCLHFNDTRSVIVLTELRKEITNND